MVDLGRVPNSDLVTNKKRPVLVVQADDAPTDLPQRIIECQKGIRVKASPRGVRVPPTRRSSLIAASRRQHHRPIDLDATIGRLLAVSEKLGSKVSAGRPEN